MASKIAVFIVLLATVGCIHGYCDFRSRELHTKISKALLQANRWLMEAQDEDGKWVNLHTTGNVLAVLKLIGHDLTGVDTCSRTFEKAEQYFMLNKFEIKQASGLKLPYLIMGLNSLCKDPSNYHSINLTKNLLEEVMAFPKGEFNHFFQYSLGLVALGINDVQVPWQAVQLLINKIKHILKTKERHSKDTCALFIMALKSVASQFQGRPNRFKKINMFINKLANALSMKTKVDEDSFWTKSLVMQAQSAANRSLPWEVSRCELLYESLLAMKEKDGSFGSLSSVLHVLPSLAGVSFLDLNKDGFCHKTAKGEKLKAGKKSSGINSSTKPWIDVCVRIEFEAINKENPMPQYVTVPEGSTALEALRMASQAHGCYRFETQKTAWGEYLTKLCRTPKSDAKKIYWIFYIDDKLSSVGLNSHVVKKNECIVMKYRKLDFKK